MKQAVSLTQYGKIVLTKDQIDEVHTFKTNLQHGSADISFEGSLIEGTAYLKGLAEIVEATNHS